MMDLFAYGALGVAVTLFAVTVLGRLTIGDDSPLARWERRAAARQLARQADRLTADERSKGWT